MVKDTLVNELCLFRPHNKKNTSAETDFTRVIVHNVKLNESSSSWVNSTDGAVQSRTATIFYNCGVSSESPALEPLFKEGDFICHYTIASVPPKDRFVVKKVVEQTFKGKLHHIEVILA